MRALIPHSAVIARLDRAIQYAAACPCLVTASGILDPRLPPSLKASAAHGTSPGEALAETGRGDDSGTCFSHSDANAF